MHLCLSCDQLCSTSSIFCDNCRLSLLERRTEETQEELQSEQLANVVGSGDGGDQIIVNLASSRSVEVAESMPTRGLGEAERMWSWDTSGIYGIDTLKDEFPVELPTKTIEPEEPPRRNIPRKVRIALLVFSIVGVLALLMDGMLVTLSITRHPLTSSPISATHQSATHVVYPKSFLPTIRTSMAPVSTPTATSTPTVSAGMFSLSVSSLAFTAVQGQNAPAGQTVKLYSNGQDTLNWRVVSTTTWPSWLHISSSQGTVSAGMAAQIVVSTQTTDLVPDAYTTHLLVKATGHQGTAIAGGSQELDVELNVLSPCFLNTSPMQLSFNANLLQPHPAAQTLSLMESGNCALPVNWSASADMSWLSLSTSSVSDNGSGSDIQVQVNMRDKLVGSYTGHIILQAIDGQNVPIPGAPLTVEVILTVIG